MKKVLYSAVILLLGSFALMSCENESLDNEKPVITVIEPMEDEIVMPGSTVHFEVRFTDNVALGSYKVDIHSAFDGHTHSTAVNGAIRIDQTVSSDYGVEKYDIRTRQATDSVAFEKTWMESDFIALGETPIAGKKQADVAHQHIVIPADVNGQPLREGHYHFIVYSTDQAGQESFVAHEIFISYNPGEHQH